MAESKVSIRYATSLIDMTSEKNNLNEISKDMELVYSAILSSDELKNLLTSPVIKSEKKISILSEIFKNKISVDSFNFIKFVVDKNREDILSNIIEKFLELRDQKLGLVRVKVKTSFDFTNEQKEKLEKRLEKMLNKKTELSFVVDKSVIGGFIAKVGDTVYDASVKASTGTFEKRIFTGQHSTKLKKNLKEFKMAEVRPDEISAILRKQLTGFESEVDIYDVGTVLQVGDGIARVYGLSKVMASELVEFPNDVFGMVLNLEEDSVGCVLFGESSLVKEGDTVKRTKRVASIPVGENMLGRVVNPLGIPVDGKGSISTEKFYPIERKALGVIQRQPVKEPIQSGIAAIDGMIPIGRGQRELIIGDRQTGKTAVAIDTIINQKYTHTKEAAELGIKPVYCIYVAVGQKSSTIAQVVAKLT